MKETKDNFSRQAETYRKFRPLYPEALYTFLFKQLQSFNTAWDCGTGNGQVAAKLAQKFEQVYASDISEKQLQQATKKENIHYLQARAEATPLPNNSIDLISVAQAIHWFDFKAFYQEVRRVGKAGALLAAWGYGLIQISSQIDPLLQQLYSTILGPYWDAERKHIDAHYRSIPFPFDEISCPAFHISTHWTREQLMGYLSSWSSLQHYLQQHKESPLLAFEETIAPYWKALETKEVKFPVFMRLGRV